MLFSVPHRQEFDDARLKALLTQGGDDLRGLRLVHLHLGLLEAAHVIDRPSIVEELKDVAATAAHVRIFNISNGDIIMLYRGLRFSEVAAACKKIEAGALAGTQMVGLTPYQERSRFSILELSHNVAHVIVYLDALGARRPIDHTLH